ncbi:flavodoxin family protein [Microbacterium sp. P01]|uniref:flavodoxin family protein n=1 Tax=Microbacterium sp. P01 TaxID=3366261 RepID=UPI003670FC56
MRALVVYESMFGNTRAAAESIALALEQSAIDVSITTASTAPDTTDCFDLLLVGAPTHAHGLPRVTSRFEADRWAADPAKNLTLEQSAILPGVREWLETVRISDRTHLLGAFSTRADILRALSGDAAVAIKRRLTSHSTGPVEMECFLVDKTNHLIGGELARARAWGISLARRAAVAA